MCIRDSDNRLIYLADPLLACNPCEEYGLSQSKKPAPSEVILEAESLDELLRNNNKDDAVTPDANDDSAPIIERTFSSAPQIIDPRIAYIIDSILQEVITRGTGTAARVLKRSDLAGKTGTTNGPTDAWFSGYHPSLVATTWLGFDDNELLGNNEYGGSAALPIWIDFMKAALNDVPMSKRQKPAGISADKIDRMTGKPPTRATTQTLIELFQEESVPDVVLRKSDSTSKEIESIHENLF